MQITQELLDYEGRLRVFLGDSTVILTVTWIIVGTTYYHTYAYKRENF